MGYRSLLVHLDLDKQCEARTRAAIELAGSDCHLSGVAPLGKVDLPAAWDTVGTLGNVANQVRDSLRKRTTEVGDRFRAACEAAGVKSFDVIVDDADKARSLVTHANRNDLSVLGQPQPATDDFTAMRAIVEQVVLNSARPSLIIPYIGHSQPIGKEVLVAWDDSREASRAVADALPLLKRADKVHLVSWDERGGVADELLHARLETMRVWLTRHGVPVEVSVERSRASIGEAMLSRAADLGVDLIVMGAYGTARWTERILGGATLGLLGSMTVPVLMSR